MGHSAKLISKSVSYTIDYMIYTCFGMMFSST
jgi:hypothetical protein